MKNRFFDIALSQASRWIGKPGRLLALVARVFMKTDRSKISLQATRSQIQLMGRMLKAYARGAYRVVPATTMISIAAALIYFLNPLDLIPDGILGIGLTDDLAVLSWVYNHLTADFKSFLIWEKTASAKTDADLLNGPL